MTTTIGMPGRFCNHVIRNLCINIIAKSNNLYVSYSYINAMKNLGIELFCGEKTYNNYITFDEKTFLYVVENNIPIAAILECHYFYQDPKISQLLYNYLHKNEVLNNVTSKNKFNSRYTHNNDIFIHIRLGDMEHNNPGLLYYVTTINKINNFDHIYIGSDTIDHPIIKKIKEMYPNTTVLDYNEIDTIQFGSTCKNVILTDGSFSCVIGYLSYYSTIYYPEPDPSKEWCPNIFSSISEWNKVNYL
jgi:hypothetical protein